MLEGLSALSFFQNLDKSNGRNTVLDELEGSKMVK